MKRKLTQQDYIKAHRRASRAEEIAAHGHPPCRLRIHRSKKVYDRRKAKAGLRRDLPDFFRRRASGFIAR